MRSYAGEEIELESVISESIAPNPLTVMHRRQLSAEKVKSVRMWMPALLTDESCHRVC